MAGLTILRVVNNDYLKDQEEKTALNELQERQNQPVILGLASYVRTCWEAAKDAKRPIEDIMLKAKRQRGGQYEPDKLASIRQQGGSEVFMRLTEVKCRSAESWVRDILLEGGETPWQLNPTPVPDLSPKEDEEIKSIFADHVTQYVAMTQQAPTAEQMSALRETLAQDYRFKMLQEAQNRADRMTDKIKDQFTEGGWYNAFDEFITDLVTYPTAFIKGPVLRKKNVLSWVKDAGVTQVETSERIVPEFERVDPFRIYPEPGITRIEDGYIFEQHPLSRSELASFIGVPGFDDTAIRYVLDNPSASSEFFNSVELTKDDLERKFSTFRSPTYSFDALEFWGKVSGKMLVEWGLDETSIPDQAKEYDACVWLVGNTVIKAVLNYDPLGEKPYAKSSFFKVPGAFWGMGIPEMIEDVQNVCNAAVRSLVNNMGIASGPQVELNIDRVPPNENITQMYPWKVWQVLNDPLGSAAPAIRFNQPDDRAASLMGVYEKFSTMADEHSGIPAYVSGDISVTGAGRTSSGLSMLMGAAGKGIRQVISHIDNDVIRVIVQRQFVFNMRFDDDEDIKGDLVVVPRGVANLAIKETINARRVEFLQATANPFDMEILGKEGRGAILKEVAKGLNMPQDEIVPSREKLAAEGSFASLAPTPTQPGAPTPLDPSGSPMGGAQGNLVSNQMTGRA